MIEELVRYVAQKANLNEQQARAAVDAAIDFAKQKAPPQYASQIDAFVKSGGNMGGLGGFGGFGQRQ